jgi:hypothetical protein
MELYELMIKVCSASVVLAVALGWYEAYRQSRGVID